MEPVEEAVKKASEDAWYEEKRREFLKEYDDPDGTLWELQKEEVAKPHYGFWPSWIDAAAAYLIQAGVEMEGMTVGGLLEKARELGLEGEKDLPENVANIVMHLGPEVDYDSTD